MRKAFLVAVAGAALAVGSSSASAQWCDNFEAYAPGSNIVGQGGWTLWAPEGGNPAFVSTEQANSGAQSLKLDTGADVVQTFNVTSGQWTLSINTWFPCGVNGDGYIILLNQYAPIDGIHHWSIQVRFNPAQGIVESQFDFNTTSLICGQWVEFRAEIDLDNDVMDLYYNGQLFAAGLEYSTNVSGAGGLTQIHALDLYSASLNGFFFDDTCLQPAGAQECYPDCDESGALNLFDFLCFTSAFNAGNNYADCDSSGNLNLFDFLCFVAAFNEGCP